MENEEGTRNQNSRVGTEAEWTVRELETKGIVPKG